MKCKNEKSKYTLVSQGIIATGNICQNSLATSKVASFCSDAASDAVRHWARKIPKGVSWNLTPCFHERVLELLHILGSESSYPTVEESP